MTVTTEEARKIVERLIQAAYDSGYYAGKNAKNADGSYPTPEHTAAMNLRNIIANHIIRLLVEEDK